ncbi:MAG: Asp-tRNA(Asn)/Glu-tRNA(Gln) amidotransferase subunit GatC [Phycisphaerales bacterium]|nr:Asp-tRNA(Asn)/Glu-tRNA(Gln) amidotransferase subunit GatC [Phycisphaerales bacterium]
MAHLSPEEVHRVARLARLTLTSDEAQALHGDLEAILQHVDALAKAPVEGVEPMNSPLGHTNRVRADEPSGGLDQATVLGLAPATEEAFVAVERVLEEGGQ